MDYLFVISPMALGPVATHDRVSWSTISTARREDFRRPSVALSAVLQHARHRQNACPSVEQDESRSELVAQNSSSDRAFQFRICFVAAKRRPFTGEDMSQSQTSNTVIVMVMFALAAPMLVQCLSCAAICRTS